MTRSKQADPKREISLCEAQSWLVALFYIKGHNLSSVSAPIQYHLHLRLSTRKISVQFIDSLSHTLFYRTVSQAFPG